MIADSFCTTFFFNEMSSEPAHLQPSRLPNESGYRFRKDTMTSTSFHLPDIKVYSGDGNLSLHLHPVMLLSSPTELRGNWPQECSELLQDVQNRRLRITRSGSCRLKILSLPIAPFASKKLQLGEFVDKFKKNKVSLLMPLQHGSGDLANEA